jgi:hypothetical protein
VARSIKNWKNEECAKHPLHHQKKRFQSSRRSAACAPSRPPYLSRVGLNQSLVRLVHRAFTQSESVRSESNLVRVARGHSGECLQERELLFLLVFLLLPLLLGEGEGVHQLSARADSTVVVRPKELVDRQRQLRPGGPAFAQEFLNDSVDPILGPGVTKPPSKQDVEAIDLCQ